MAELRALIVDDEPLARRGIRQLLDAHGDVVVVGECRDGAEAAAAIRELRPDLVFLDIEMPGIDGVRLVDVLGAARMPLIVFVTAHDEFALYAFDAHAVDYLVKPLTRARFDESMKRVRRRLGERRSEERIVVPGATGERVVDIADIDWVEAQDDYVILHAGAQHHRLRASLAAIEARLDAARFMRVHRSALVRLDRVAALRRTDRGAGVLVLRGGAEVPVSRRRMAIVRERLRGSDDAAAADDALRTPPRSGPPA